MKKSCIYIWNDCNCDFLEYCSIYILVGSCCPLVGPNKRRWLEAPQWTRFFHQRHVSLHLWKQLHVDLDVSQDCINHVIIQPSVRVISEGHMRWDRAILNTFYFWKHLPLASTVLCFVHKTVSCGICTKMKYSWPLISYHA